MKQKIWYVFLVSLYLLLLCYPKSDASNILEMDEGEVVTRFFIGFIILPANIISLFKAIKGRVRKRKGSTMIYFSCFGLLICNYQLMSVNIDYNGRIIYHLMNILLIGIVLFTLFKDEKLRRLYDDF